MLLNELDLGKLMKKAGINKQPPTKEFPQRSGNLETPAKNLRHRKFMGQDPSGRGTMADKPGRESSENSVHATPTTMDDPSGIEGEENLGEPLSRGLSDGLVGDDATMHPSAKKHKPTRLQGPAEDPGAQTWTSFGNRYPGAR
jgi:hypothetical protein